MVISSIFINKSVRYLITIISPSIVPEIVRVTSVSKPPKDHWGQWSLLLHVDRLRTDNNRCFHFWVRLYTKQTT